MLPARCRRWQHASRAIHGQLEPILLCSPMLHISKPLHAASLCQLGAVTQALTVMELSSLLAGAKLLPKRGSGSLTKASLVALMQDALNPAEASTAHQVSCPAQLLSSSPACCCDLCDMRNDAHPCLLIVMQLLHLATGTARMHGQMLSMLEQSAKPGSCTVLDQCGNIAVPSA